MAFKAQDVFDTIMLLVTETVSSEDYLRAHGIHRSAPISASGWPGLVKKVTNQTSKKGVLPKPGIYPRSYSGSVHYYAIRNESAPGEQPVFTVGNGYPNTGGFGSVYGVALDAQPNKSHGLCQTFALMYYNNNEGLLRPGQYQTNIRIGLQWLKKFTKDNGWQWHYDTDITTIQDGHYVPNAPLRMILRGTTKTIRGTNVNLHDLVAWLISDQQAPYLAAWAADLGPDMVLSSHTEPGNRKRKLQQQQQQQQQ